MCSGKNFGKASTSCKGSVTMGWEVLQQSLKLSTSHHLSHNPHPHPVPKTPRGPLCKDLKNILISTPRTTEGPTETKCLPAPVSCLYQDSHICVGSIGDPFAPPHHHVVPMPFLPVSQGYLAALSGMNLFGLGALPSLLLVLGLHGWLWLLFRGHTLPVRLGLFLAGLQIPRPFLGCPR